MNEIEIKESYLEGVFDTLTLMLKRQKYYRLVINGSVFKFSDITTTRNSVVGVQLVNDELRFGKVLSRNKPVDFQQADAIEKKFIDLIYDMKSYGVNLTGVVDIKDISIHVATDLNLILIETATFKFIRDELVLGVNGSFGDEKTDTTNYYAQLKSILRGIDFSDSVMEELDLLYLNYNKLFTVDTAIYRVPNNMLPLTDNKNYVELSGSDLEYARDYFIYRLKSNYIDIFNISMNAIKSKDTNYMESSESQFLNYTGALLAGNRDTTTFLPVFITHSDFINPYLDFIPNVVKLFRNFTVDLGLHLKPKKYGNFKVYYLTQLEINIMLDNRNLVYLDSKSLQLWLLNKTYRGEENTVYVRVLDTGNTIIDYYTYNSLSTSEKSMYQPRPATDLLAATLATLLNRDTNTMVNIVNGIELI